MTQRILITAFLLGSASLTACSDPESRTPPASGPADQTRPEPFEQADEAMPGDTGRATGRITSLDRDDGRVTIDHGPFEGIAMGAMTMSFALMGDLELTDLSEGDDVIFQVKRGRDGSHRIMEICSIPANGRDCPDQETVYPDNPPGP